MSAAAPTTTQAPVKSWVMTVIELFNEVRVSPSIDEKAFVEKLGGLIRQIQEQAIVKFEIQEKERNRYLHVAFNVAATTPKDEAVSALVSTELFQLLVATRLQSLDPEDHDYYLNDITVKMLQEMASVTKLDLSFINDNLVVREWFCRASETMQRPKERLQMRMSMSQLPRDYYDATRGLRSQIGRMIDTQPLCLEVRKLFKGKNDKGLSDKAHEIYQKYLVELFAEKTPLELRAPLKQNLIVSLGIRARQLPKS